MAVAPPGGSTAPHHLSPRGRGQHGCPQGGPYVRGCRESGPTRGVLLPRERKHNAVLCTVGFRIGDCARLLWRDLTKHSITLAYKTPCDFEVTTIIIEQAWKSNSFPEPQKLLPASCPQAFPAPEASFLSKDTRQLQKELLYSNYFTWATPYPDSEAKAPAPPAGLAHPVTASQHLASANQWKKAALPPAARAPTGFSSTPAGLGQITPRQKQSLETITKANSKL